MATFHSLTPPMGSVQNRQALDMFQVELELALPQDCFLPADEIQAEVWTNIIHKLNPDGPEVWTAVPMKLSHVIPGQSIAVFSARLQPTGRGDFGLTARWKSYRNTHEWDWAPPAVDNPCGDGEEPKSRDVNISVKIPRDISGAWVMGPQSVMVWGENGPRVSGTYVGGPGLYLGNHAAATRARIAGYEAVLSLVSGVLDFDENIPETDRDLNKQVWEEQAKAMSRSSSASSHHSGRNGNGNGNGGGLGGWSSETAERPNLSSRNSTQSKRTSVIEFMQNNEPDGERWDSDKISAAVVDEPDDGPRLARRSSVTDMMVKPPTTSRRAMSRSTISTTPIGELEQDLDLSGKQGAPAKPAATEETAPAPAPAPNRSHSKGEGPSGPGPTSQGKRDASTTVTEAAAGSLAAPPASDQETGKKKEKKETEATKIAPSAEDSENADTIKTTGSPMITSPDIIPAPDVHRTGTNRRSSFVIPGASYASKVAASLVAVVTDALKKDEHSESPPSSARIVTGISKSFLGSSPPSSLADGSRVLQPQLSPQPQQQEHDPVRRKHLFEHKVITMTPGAHSIIPEAVLREAVEFLTAQVGQGKKVLVHCRDGNGRSGSVAVAYIASQMERDDKPSHYDEALEEIWKWKCDVYPHKGLKQTFEKIGW
ncbi:MAG: hypothetical protein J3Q66DRAFT_326019 [Benniella sp.]|nr:MAG: hypothetical protein J3Q66DRAFT_326019 [Benniella sp.]